jgi:hypothetical protein
MQRKLSYRKIKKNKNIMNVYNHTRVIMTLGYSSVNSNQVLQPNIAGGGANPSNAHFTNSFGSIVGGTTGCGGAGGSAAALAAKPGYNIVQKGGKRSKRGCSKRGGSKRGGSKRGGSKRGGSMRGGSMRGGSKRRGKRSKRGGLSAMSPSSVSGGTGAHYSQFTGGQPLSFNYGLGSRTPLPLNLIGGANPPPMMDIRNNCGSNHGLVGKGLLN